VDFKIKTIDVDGLVVKLQVHTRAMRPLCIMAILIITMAVVYTTTHSLQLTSAPMTMTDGQIWDTAGQERFRYGRDGRAMVSHVHGG
jgi:GTPase SAR1 family protein